MTSKHFTRHSKTKNDLNAINNKPLKLCFKCEEPCLEDNDVEKNIEEQSIDCDSCKKWIHKKCLDRTVNENQWDFIRSSNPCILFKCTECVSEKANLFKEFRAELTKEMTGVKDEVQSLRQAFENNTDRVITEMKNAMMPQFENLIKDKITEHTKELDHKYEERISKLEKEMKECKNNQPQASDPPTTQSNLEKMIKDVKSTEMNLESKIKSELKVYMDNHQDKDSRKNNIIILRLNEQSGGDVKENIEKDRNELKKLLEITNPELKAEMEEILNKKRTFRLGRNYKEGDKPRPIKIELPDEDMKKDIFEGCKYLKNSIFEHVSVQNDLTIAEQKQNYKLRQELRERKSKGEEVCIYNNTIILKADHPKNETSAAAKENPQ